MPEEGVKLSPTSNLLTTEEIVRIAELFVSQVLEQQGKNATHKTKGGDKIYAIYIYRDRERDTYTSILNYAG